MTRSRLVLAAALAAAATGSSLALAAPRTAAAQHDCVGDPSDVHRLTLTVDGVRTFGLYALPAQRPKGIVVFDHGYGHTAYSWSRHLSEVAARDGVITIAMDYHGQTDLPPASPGGLPSSRGWRVQEGADDSIAAARRFDASCATDGVNTIYGVSMGGNTSGLVVAAKPSRADGSPLFDYWFAVEPAANVTETWAEATAIAQSGNAFGRAAAQDIEQEMGGTPATAPTAYRDRTVVARIADIAAAGLRGVSVVQGVDDGLVPYNQSRELVAALRAAGVTTDDTTIGTRGDDEAGTTASGYVLGPAGQQSPFAGHGSEVSSSQLVIRTGFDLLDRLYVDGHPPSCSEGVRDGDTGAWQSSPATC